MADLTSLGRIHLIGAGGAGMSGLAKLLAQQGVAVSGSDLKPSRSLDALGDLGVSTWVGHRPEAASDWGLVVASSAVPASDPEMRAATEAGAHIWRRPQLLAALTEEMPAVGISGTHGKTTSTAMAIVAARAAGADPSYLVGGELVDLNTNAHLGDRGLFVLEADEAFGTFVDLHYRALMITAIESDHLDHYGTVGALEEAFATVAAGVDGPVVVGIDDPGARRLAEALPAIGYGTSPDAAWSIQHVEHGPARVRFDLVGGESTTGVEVPRPGMHVARNAAGILALLAELGHDPSACAGGLKNFGGVRRRFEVRARLGGVTVIDDYAHLPTEVGETIAAARLGHWQRVWGVFQPHRFSRTQELAAAFGPALAGADHVIVTDVYGAGEAPRPGITGKLVADAALAAGADSVDYVPQRADLAAFLDDRVEDGDLVLLMGAGDITTVADELSELLEGRG